LLLYFAIDFASEGACDLQKSHYSNPKMFHREDPRRSFGGLRLTDGKSLIGIGIRKQGVVVILVVTSLFITFCVSCRRRKMYCSHARLLCVCLSAAVCPQYCMDPDVTWGRGRGCSLVVHYWADLQSVHRLRCYGNTTRTLVYAGCARVAD